MPVSGLALLCERKRKPNFQSLSLLTGRQRRVLALEGKRSRVIPLIRQHSRPPRDSRRQPSCARAFTSRAAHSLTCCRRQSRPG